MNKKFWIVWCPSSHTPPRYRHAAKGNAVAEAKRLAIENPGSEFFVLAACNRVKKYECTVEDLNTDDQPF